MPAAVSDRTRGWLRFIWDKATTEDDWSINGTPHEWWDRDSTPPMCTFPRFDLSETAYILPVLADQTPAWREVYSRIADELVGRFTTFWAAIDWITMVGHDPNQDQYPPEWLAYLPPHLQGRYNPPGWPGNGIEPWGLQPDPIAADGNLFFRGFFTLLLGTYRYVTGDEKWEQPFNMVGYREQTFEWTHHRIAEFLNQQWKDRPQGPHCENTKIWPFCLSGAGLGLQLTDNTTGTKFHGVYDEWVEFAKKNFLKMDRKGGLLEFPWYYDPIEEVVFGHQVGATPFAALGITPYVLPQNREFGEYLYREAVRMLGWDDTKKPFHQFLPDPRFLPATLLIAQDLGDTTTTTRIREYMEEHCEPRWFGDEGTRFGWWFGSGEEYPRGQLSALTMVCEAADKGAWSRAYNNTDHKDRFSEPTVEGIDYPTVGVMRAWNDPQDGVLNVSTYAATPSKRGTPTSFRVTNLPDTDAVSIRLDGADYTKWRATSDNTIEIDAQVGDQEFRITTGVRGGSRTETQSASVDSTRVVTGASTARKVYSTAGVKTCSSSCC